MSPTICKKKKNVTSPNQDNQGIFCPSICPLVKFNYMFVRTDATQCISIRNHPYILPTVSDQLPMLRHLIRTTKVFLPLSVPFSSLTIFLSVRLSTNVFQSVELNIHHLTIANSLQSIANVTSPNQDNQGIPLLSSLSPWQVFTPD